MINDMPLDLSESVIFKLRSLYNSYGYSQYKMSKFEEYDLYSRNKDFLISDRVITFTDLSGKLMALKPDVTLSIVKNTEDNPNTINKLYYNENVYRASKNTASFKETMQVGLESIGNVDNITLCEVLILAAKSLKCISEESIIDISHIGLLSELIDGVGVPFDKKGELLNYIGEKNVHDLSSALRLYGVSEENISLIKEVISLNGSLKSVLPKLQKMLNGAVREETLKNLSLVLSSLQASQLSEMFRFDLSVVDDVNYYNGIVFKGFIHGIPTSVLSGGQYDNLMKRMKKESKAVGFAVYMDTLERLNMSTKEYDTDTLLLYNEGEDISLVLKLAEEIKKDAKSVMIQQSVPENIKFRQIVKAENGEVKIIENDA